LVFKNPGESDKAKLEAALVKRAEGWKARQRRAGKQSERPRICLSASELFSARPKRVQSRIPPEEDCPLDKQPSVERVRPIKK